MNFFELMRLPDADGISVPVSWGQGRSVFGGLAAALVYRALRARAPAERPVRSLAITFVAPMQCEVPVRIEVEVLREGRAVSQLLGRAMQNGEVVTLMQGSFGAARDSSIAVEPLSAPSVPGAADTRELPFLPGVTPEFTRYLSMSWVQGGMPFSGTPERKMGGWVRFRGETPRQAVDEAALLALVDAWPPAPLSYLRRPAPGSSLTWTIEFMQPLPAADVGEPFLYQARIERVRDGYGHVAANLWTERGELLAISRQTVVIFD
ncbi:MAG TPA: thioesterase family protein [Pseudomonas sp.]|nr:thioesterase family protein [Pseudomonas sp.]